MTTLEVARILNCSDGYIRRLCRAGQLGSQLGRNWWITEEQLTAFRQQRIDRRAKRTAKR